MQAKKIFSALGLAGLLSGFLGPQMSWAAGDFSHDRYNALVSKAVHGRLVDYSLIQKDGERLTGYLAAIAQAKTKSLTKDEATAFYVNAYNALVLKEVIAHRLPESVLQIPGFFDKKKHRVAGEDLTLNELEEKKVRSTKDPRVHFVVNCASIDCPPLAPFAYDKDRFQEQLEQQTQLFLSRKGEIQIGNKGKTIELSSLFKWYEKDWGSKKKVREFIGRYRKDLVKYLSDPSFQLKYRAYNWNLNSEPRK